MMLDWIFATLIVIFIIFPHVVWITLTCVSIWGKDDDREVCAILAILFYLMANSESQLMIELAAWAGKVHSGQ